MESFFTSIVAAIFGNPNNKTTANPTLPSLDGTQEVDTATRVRDGGHHRQHGGSRCFKKGVRRISLLGVSVFIGCRLQVVAQHPAKAFHSSQ